MMYFGKLDLIRIGPNELFNARDLIGKVYTRFLVSESINSNLITPFGFKFGSFILVIKANVMEISLSLITRTFGLNFSRKN